MHHNGANSAEFRVPKNLAGYNKRETNWALPKESKMKKTLILLAMVAAVTFTGCGSAMASVSGNVGSNNGKKVQAETSSMNILMLTPMKLEKAEEAVKSLANQCGGGEVVNVTSHWKNTSYSILAFETLSVSGFCK
jgi:hypothetical protein